MIIAILFWILLLWWVPVAYYKTRKRHNERTTIKRRLKGWTR